jgi:hypothetical protein
MTASCSFSTEFSFHLLGIPGFFFFFFFVVLGFELRAYTLSHSTNLCVCDGFFWDRVLRNCFPRLASNHGPPDLSLLCSKDYRRELPVPGWISYSKCKVLFSFI